MPRLLPEIGPADTPSGCISLGVKQGTATFDLVNWAFLAAGDKRLRLLPILNLAGFELSSEHFKHSMKRGIDGGSSRRAGAKPRHRSSSSIQSIIV